MEDIGRERDLGAVPGGHDHRVTFDDEFVARTILGNTLGTTVQLDSVLREFMNVTTKPQMFAVPYQVEDSRVEIDTC